MSLFLRGLLIGLAIAAPVGPIGVLCIRRTLAEGRVIGFITGLGAATADMLYGAVAAFGLTAISGLLVSEQRWLRLIGGMFLCYLGVRTLLTRPRPADRAATSNRRGTHATSAYLSTLGLTLTNPLTILSFVAIFAGIGVGATGGSAALAGLIVLGVFCGSALWWLTLSGAVSLLRDRFDARGLLWVNRVSGAVILTFGVVALAGVVR